MTAWESSAPVNCVIRPSFRAVRHGKGTVERDYSNPALNTTSVRSGSTRWNTSLKPLASSCTRLLASESNTSRVAL